MPFYEYTCSFCDKSCVLQQSIAEHKAPDCCPECGKKGGMKRQFSANAVVFKGSGFYCTDSKRKKA